MSSMIAFIRRCFQTRSEQEINPSEHWAPLDGVRGLAVLMVLCYDCLKLPGDGMPWTFVARKFAATGWSGVDLFFVLSGFLITGILLESRGRTGYWKSFLMRRSVRIFPLYYATLLVVFLGFPLAVILGFLSHNPIPNQLADQQNWYWFYGQNWLFASQGTWPEGRVLNHFWSLAVEEQFYLVWPLVVAVLPTRSLKWFSIALFVTALGLRYWLLSNGTPGVTTYVMTITRMDSLCAGAIAAIFIREHCFIQRWGRYLPALAIVSAGTLFAVDQISPVLQSQSFAAYSIGHSLLAVTFSLIILALVVCSREHIFARAFSIPPLRVLGKYSYAIYVFHRFVYMGVVSCHWHGLSETYRGWAIFGATVLGSLLAAEVSWRLLEQPFLSLKKYFPRPELIVPMEVDSAENNVTDSFEGPNDDIDDDEDQHPGEFTPLEELLERANAL